MRMSPTLYAAERTSLLESMRLTTSLIQTRQYYKSKEPGDGEG